MTPSRIVGLCVLLLGLSISNVWSQNFHWRRFQTEPGQSWHSVAFNPLSKGRTMFAGSGADHGVYRSDDGGLTWVETIHPTDVPFVDVHQVFCDPGDTNVVLAVTPTRFLRSVNGGRVWVDVPNMGGVNGEEIAYNAAEGALYFAQNFGPNTPVWRSLDHGATWVPTDAGDVTDSIGLCSLDVSQDISPILLQGSETLANKPGGLIARSVDRGKSWLVVIHPDTTTSKDAEVSKIMFSYYAREPLTGKHNIAIALRWLSQTRSIVATTDGGVTWRVVNAPDRHVWALDMDQRASMLSTPAQACFPLPLHYFVGILFEDNSTPPSGGMVQETTDGGNTWRSTNFPTVSGPGITPAHQVWVLKYDTTSGRLLVAGDSGIYVGEADGSVSSAPKSEPLRITQSNGHLLVETERSISTLRIYDLLGHSLVDASHPGSRYDLNTSQFTPGVYFVELSESGGPPTIRTFILP